jgi:diguanylate cyclase (GGDEF)-like protein/PAS domain S-box-containing protein
MAHYGRIAQRPLPPTLDGRLTGRLRGVLPTGDTLSPVAWQRRHRWIAHLVGLHALILPIYALSQGVAPGHAAVQALPVIALAVIAWWPRPGTLVRSLAATFGLVITTTLLIHLSGGLIEMHFHFFLVVSIVSLYHAWQPFLAALGVVLVHHGWISQMDPSAVYNHPAAIARPWLWALIHTGFIVAASAVSVIAWRLNEDALDHERQVSDELAAAQRIAGIGSFDWDLEADTSVWTKEMYRLFGIPPETEPSLGLFLSRLHPDDQERVAMATRSVHDYAEEADYEARIVLPDGTERIVHARAQIVRRHRGRRPHIRGTFQDITERKALEREIEYRAFYDELTGLANRSLFMDRLEHALEQRLRSGATVTVLFLDLDAFKAINDRFGHRAGDELLVETARRLSRACRSTDTVARLGGDEFAVLFESSAADDLRHTVDRLLGELAIPVQLTACKLPGIAASSGVADTSHALDSDTLLHHADAAMYRAKRGESAQVQVFAPDMLDDNGRTPTLSGAVD